MNKTRFDQLLEEVKDFHSRHPEVWKMFVEFTFDRISRGFEHYSANAVFERIRWEVETVGGYSGAEFKLNNNYRAFYARRFMKMYPQHEGFFRTRAQTSRLQDRAVGAPLGPGDFPTWPNESGPVAP